VLRSEEIDNASWVKADSTISSNTIVAPDGTLSGDKIIETTATASPRVAQAITTSAIAYTYSVYAKAGERNWIVLQITDSSVTDRRAWFNILNGTIGTVNTNLTASIVFVGNGWYRCSITVSAAEAGSNSITLRASTADNVTSYTGDGYSGIYIWGAQLEAGAKASSYIKTEASQVTRSADSGSDSTIDDWFNPAEGTLYVEVNNQRTSGGANFCTISDGTNNNIIELSQTAPTTSRARMFNNGTAQVEAFIAIATEQFNKHTISYKFNDTAMTNNGLAPTTDTSCIVAANCSQLVIGNRSTGDASIIGHIKKLAFYPKRLTNAQLQALTS
jgi:hypothetical protein